MVPTDECIDQLLALSGPEELRIYLAERAGDLTPDVIAALEAQVEKLRLSDPLQAMRRVDFLVQIAEIRLDEIALANALRLRGNQGIHLGRYEDSIKAYAQSRQIRQKYGDEVEIARLQVGWTAALKNMARFEEALEMALQTQSILLKHEKWLWLANLELNLGSIYRLLDRYPEAQAVYEQCQQHFLALNNPVGAAQAQVNTARALGCQDRYLEAQALLRQARMVFVEKQVFLQIARTDFNLGLLALGMGHNQEAWEHFGRSRAAYVDLKMQVEIAVVDLYCAQVYLALNLLGESLSLLRQARLVFEQERMERHVALADYISGAVYRGQGSYPQAQQLLEKAAAFFEKHHEPTWAAWITLEQAGLLHQLGRAEDALGKLEPLETVFAEYHLPVRQAQLDLIVALCRLDLGETQKARDLYQSVLAIPPEQQPASLAWRAAFGLAQIERAESLNHQAYLHLQTAVEHIRHLREAMLVDEFRASVLDDKLAVYEAAVEISLETGRLEDAFHYAEQAKSSALLDLLSVNLELRAGREAVDPGIWERLRALKEEWRWHTNKLDTPPAEGKEDAQRVVGSSTTWEHLHQIESEIQQVARRLHHHPYASLTQREEQALLRLPACLGAGTVLIEYFGVGDRLIAFLVGKDVFKVCTDFPAPLSKICEIANRLQARLHQPPNPQQVQSVLEPLAKRRLQELFQALLQPLESDLIHYAKLVIVPHDSLHYLPFHALYDGQQFLIERYEISYAPSAEVLALCYQPRVNLAPPPDIPALILGYSDHNRLPFVCAETAVIAQIDPKALLFQEERATLQHLKEYANRCRLLHIASHASFRADNPLFSSVQLADEPLNVIDIYNLKLSASLITLSACETGVSRLKGGDLFGLTRGCLYAGVPSVVASLWKVEDDSTALLMQAFYTHLRAGQSIRAALRSAQLALLQTGPDGGSLYRYPHYWAPFFLTGADQVLF